MFARCGAKVLKRSAVQNLAGAARQNQEERNRCYLKGVANSSEETTVRRIEVSRRHPVCAYTMFNSFRSHYFIFCSNNFIGHIRRTTHKTPAGNGGKMMSDSRSLSPVRHMCFCEESSLWTLLTSSPALSVLSSWPPNFENESHCSCGVRHDGSALVLKAIRC
jgi:hypothetical protein